MIAEDTYGRKFSTLRVSLINTCNLGCVYCACGQEELRDHHTLQKEQALSAQEMIQIIGRLHEQLNLQTLRLTGGEPLLYTDLEFVIRAATDMGIEDIAMTTNAVLLSQQAEILKRAGLKSVNVSLDALNEEAFFKMSRRRGLHKILEGIEKAIKCGLSIKLNTVVMKGINEDQILPLLEYAFSKGLKIRFLEIMAMGHLHEHPERHFFSQQEILSLVGTRYNIAALQRDKAATARYWQADNSGIFGIIANESAPFCEDCDRLRLDSFGNIYGCLSSNSPVDVKSITHAGELNKRLAQAMSQKQMLKFTGSDLSMMHIGG